MKMLKLFTLIAMLMLGLVLLGCGGGEDAADEGGEAAAKVLKIGTLSPITGDYAADGNDIANGVRVAVEVFKAQGGIEGYSDIVVVSEDSACDGRQAVAGANKLLSSDVAGVVGAYCSSATIPSSEVLNEGPLPMITPASTNPDVTLRGLQHMWRMCGIDAHQSKAAALFMEKVLEAKTVFILDDKTTYSQHLAEFVAEECHQMGIEVVAHEHVNQGDIDFSAVLAKIKATNPDVFYMSLQNSAAGIPFIKQYRQAGLENPVLSQDAVFHPNFISQATEEAQGVYFTYGFIDETTDLYKLFVEKYAEMVPGVTPGGYAFYAFDSATALLTAIKDGGSTEPEAIREQLLGMTLQGITKTIKFQENGDSGSNYVILKVDGDKFVPYYNPDSGEMF